ncbi:hypothetical protein BU25DRAFT_413809 [Macroventuria anomochaeta]|uniref:Uncharacterized protein n=1 Tax=Macroventuria anomochaeta TaxID=301207 RepID=A0ACB6RR80_9PLEO|nr:uncharacterized protein BU25DRAFT_413809 [Macroventuria anomochaeta]KAF2624253.1 hypothetical protein BU25DRAFT_413809 [Macroventuria anomochaeta]
MATSSSPSSPSSFAPSFPSPPAYSAHSSSSQLWKIKNAKYRSTFVKKGQPSVEDLQNHLEYIRDPHFTSAVSEYT